jgi:hypothetical protein
MLRMGNNLVCRARLKSLVFSGAFEKRLGGSDWMMIDRVLHVTRVFSWTLLFRSRYRNKYGAVHEHIT